MTTSVLGPNCAIPPQSMSGVAYANGCHGAVWANGRPSQAYCTGNSGAYPWWSACCEWDGSACNPKHTDDYDCSILPLSMNGASHPSGCPGAMWSNGQPSRSYCEGLGGVYALWSTCCQWDAGYCTHKPTTTTSLLAQRPRYVIGEASSLDCPYRYAAIYSSSECQVAAQVQKLVWRGSENAQTWPGGCYKTSNHVYYNLASPGEARSITNILCQVNGSAAGLRRLTSQLGSTVKRNWSALLV